MHLQNLTGLAVIAPLLFALTPACDGDGAAGAGGGGGSAGGTDGGTVPDLGPCPIEAAPNPVSPDALVPDPANDPGCPSELGPGTCATPDTICHYDVPCQSGPIAFGFDCDDGSLLDETSAEQVCDLIHDTCPSISMHCRAIGGGGMAFTPAVGTDMPALCPWDRPAEGSPCTVGNYGGPTCGFWCGSAEQTWTIAECLHLEGKTGHSYDGYWKFDDACACSD